MAEASPTHPVEVSTGRFRFPWANVIIAMVAVATMVTVVLMARDDLPTINWVFVAGLVSISGLVLTVMGIYNGSLSKRLDTLETALLKQGDRLQAEIRRQGDTLQAAMLRQGDGLNSLREDLQKQGDRQQAEIQRQVDRLESLREDMQNLSHEVHGLGERVAGLEGRYGWPPPAGKIPTQSLVDATNIGPRQRDYTRYHLQVGDESYTALSKRRLIFHIVKAVLENGGSPARVASAITQPSLFIIVDGRVRAEQVISENQRSRYFCKRGELFYVDGKTCILSNQWGTTTLDTARKLSAILPELNCRWTPA